MQKILLSLLLIVFSLSLQAQVREVKIMAANITSGPRQQYEDPGIHIFQAFKPDICAIQEFNYAGNIQELVQKAFGPDYRYYRESFNNPEDIPNGIVYHQDFVCLDKGSWPSSQIVNRGFAYVRLDIPGANNPHLLVISVHLSTKWDKQTVEAGELMNHLLKYYRVNKATEIKDFVVVAGDFNASWRDAEVIEIMTDQPGELVDRHVPVDQQGKSATNASRQLDHDFVLPNALLDQYHTTLIIGNSRFPAGLIFDSRVYSPLKDVYPVREADSAAENMQHMAVIKVFAIPSN